MLRIYSQCRVRTSEDTPFYEVGRIGLVSCSGYTRKADRKGKRIYLPTKGKRV